MTRKLLLTLSCGAFFLGGCRQYAYYQSPFHGNTSSYKVMPVGSDKPQTETYASGALFTGGSGDRLRDGSWGINANLYRSHSVGILRAFYGITGTAGSYRVRHLRSNNTYEPESSYPNDSLISARSGSKFFGGIGGSAGLYLTVPIKDDGEWRLIGLELNYQNEFGHYLSFRKKLPDSAANLISRPAGQFSLGIHTDLELGTKRGTVGLKLGGVFSTRSETIFYSLSNAETVSPGYFSMTVHNRIDRTTWFWQMNFGTYTFNLMTGINYRL